MRPISMDSSVANVPGADSDACRSPIPIQADHRFRRMAITDSDMPIGDSDMPITDSDACRSLWSERVGALDNPL